MSHSNFTINLIRRMLNSRGKDYTFLRDRLNSFGEPSGDTDPITIRGLFHESTGYLPTDSQEGGSLHKKSSPMMLCLWEDPFPIKVGDTLSFDELKYVVSGVKDLSNLHIAVDISLEEVQLSG